MRVVVADDALILREGLARLLAEAGFEIAGLAADADELLSLVETGGLPAVVTLMGKGCLPDSHPLNYGAPGMHGSKYANWALNKCDLIVAVDGKPVDREDALVRTISQKRVGDTLVLTIVRNGRNITLPVKLLRPPADLG